jgi:hypothetical protein
VANSVELATGYVSLAVSTQGMGRQIAQGFKSVDVEADRAGKRGGKKFSAGLGTAAKVGIGAVALAGFGAAKGLGSAITAAGDLEQSVGGVQAVFGKYAKQIDNSSRAAAKSVGLSRDEYNKLATVVGAGLKNKGIKDFAAQTENLIGLGGDLAAQFGGSSKEAVEAIGAALRGESDPIEKYGVSLNETAVNAELAAKGQDKLKGAALDQAKTQARLALIFRQTKDAQGAFGRESDTLQGKQQRATAQWQNLSASMGGIFLPIASKVMGLVSDRLVPAIQRLVDWVGPRLGPAFAALGRFVAPLGPVFAEITGGIRAFAAGMQYADGEVTSSGFPGFMERVAGVLSTRVLPAMRQMYAVVMPALAAGFRAVASFIATQVVPRVISIGQAFGTLVTTVAPIVRQIFGALVGAVKQNMPVIQGAFQSIRTIITDVLDAIRVHIQNVTRVIQFIWSRWGNQITAVARTVFGIIIKVIGNALKVVSGIVKVVTGLMTGDWRKMGEGFKTIALALASIQRVIWNGIKSALTAILTALIASLRSKWEGFLNWTATKLKAGLAKVKEFVLAPIRAARDGIKTIMDQMASKFDAGVKAIGKAWDGLKAKAKAPVSFVVNTVLNKGLVGTFNKIAKAVGIGTRLPSVSFDRGGYTGPGGKYQPAGVVHADEFVVRKESRQKFERQNPGFLDYLNRTGTLPGYALGGEVEQLRGVMGRLKGAGSGPFAEVAKAGARKLGDAAITKVKDAVKKLLAQVGAGVSGAVRAVIGSIGGGSGGIRRLAGAMGASLSAHRDPQGGPAFDIFPRGSNAALGNAFRAAHSKLGLRYVISNMRIASARGGWNWRRYSPITTSGDYRHTRHTHVSYDQGGWLPPGLTLAYNGTGKPERIRTEKQEKQLQGGAGINIYGGSFGYDPDSIARAWEDRQRQRAALVPAW